MCGTMEEKEKVEEFKSFKEASRSFFFCYKLPLREMQYHWLRFQGERVNKRSWNFHGCNTTGWASKEKEWKREGEVGPAASDPFSLNFLREENNPSPNSIIFPWSWQEMSNFALFPSKYFCPIIISSSLKTLLKENVRVIESEHEHPTRAFLRRLPTTPIVTYPHKLLKPKFLWDFLKL